MEKERAATSSLEEDVEMETLVSRNGRNSSPDGKRPGLFQRSRFAAVAGSDFGSLWNRITLKLCSSWKYILLLCLPLVITLAFFSLDLRTMFHGVSETAVPGVAVGQPGGRMREAELRALYLLRNQRSSLEQLLGRPSDAFSAPNFTTPLNFTASAHHVPFEGFRSALLEQIRLNREIQNVLLSAHSHAGNSSTGSSEDEFRDMYLSDPATEICRKVPRPAERRTIEWKPRKNRYLFAICLSGQMSNHLICLQKHMFVAALLDRALVIPSPHFDYQYDRVIDINHINNCIGRKVVHTFEEFSSLMKKKMRIDRFICYIANPPCYVDGEHARRLRGLGLSLANLEAAWPEDAKSTLQKKRVSADIKSRFASEDEVLAIGDMFYADLEEEWVMQPGGPLSHTCKSVIQPSHLIKLTAERFIQTFLGDRFIALHFRRHGFLKFCNAKSKSCFFPVPQAAECILHVVEKANAPLIYLSTDAAESETNLLQSLVVTGGGKIVPMIKRPGHNHAEKWDALLYRNHLGEDNQVEAMLDKAICAMSSVFIGSSGSTFTDDIFRLRADWELASVCDENLCQGQQPNFIASKE